MNLLWLNRIGIILNFLAGFMIAPELIGIERLRRSELYIEETLHSLRAKLDILYVALIKPLKIIHKEIRSITNPKGDSFKSLIFGIFLIFGIVIFSILTPFNDTVLLCVLGIVYINVINFLWNYFFPRGGQEPSLFGIPISLFLRIALYFPIYIIWQLVELLLISMVFLVSLLIIFPIIIILFIFRRVARYFIKKLEGEQGLRRFLVWWGIFFFILGNALQLFATF